jgi:glutamate/tyrosine decarboxylase-like PLP-dependent enzyme
MNDALGPLRQELEEPLPHPDSTQLESLSGQVIGWLIQHFRTLPDQTIGKTGCRKEMEALLRERPPEEGQPFAQVFAEFQEKVAPYAFRVNHPRFLAFVPSAPTFLSVLGDVLCAGTNFFAGVWLEAAGPAQVELVVLDWFRDFLGLPPTTCGLLTSGGSEANLTALLVAREHLSFEDRRRAVLYVTEHRHWSVDRAAKIVGLRPEQVCPVAAAPEFRLELVALRKVISHQRRTGQLPWAVVANAGATNTGAVDPLSDLADLCRAENLWLHVDAAYGWPVVLVSEESKTMAGISRCDSITLDPHKWFGQTFEAGCLLVREGQRLAETFAIRPDYMQDVEPADDEINFADHGLALTRRFRALKIWLSVKVLGVDWFRRMVKRCCRLADLAQMLLEKEGVFEILCPRRLSIVCFRYRSERYEARDGGGEKLDALNLAIIEELRVTGRAFISSTRLNQRVALRFCFVNWRTTTADVEEIIGLLASIGNRLAASIN